MKRLVVFGMLSTALAVTGCTSTGKPLPDRIVEEKPAIEPVKPPIKKARVEADRIDETNYPQQAKQLEAELRRDGRDTEAMPDQR